VDALEEIESAINIADVFSVKIFLINGANIRIS